MMRRWWTKLGLAAVLLLVSCQLSAGRSERQRRQASAPAAASAAPESAADGGAIPPSPTPAVPEAPAGAAEAGPAADGSTHCPDPPERIAAREEMARMKADHDALAVKLAPIHDALLATAGQLLAARPWDEIRATAREFAARVSAIPGWHQVGMDTPERALEQAALLLVACQSLGEDRTACDVADAIVPGGAGICRLLSSNLGRVHGVEHGDLPGSALVQVPHNPESPELTAARAAAVGGDLTACARLGELSGDKGEWVAALCRVNLTHDLAPCDDLKGPGLRLVCRAVGTQTLAALGNPPPAAGPADAAMAQQVNRLASGTDCEAAARDLLAADPNLAAAFTAGALMVPQLEVQRGLVAP